MAAAGMLNPGVYAASVGSVNCDALHRVRIIGYNAFWETPISPRLFAVLC